MVRQVTPSVSSFIEYLGFFSEFFQISIGPSDVIPLAAFDIRPPKKLIYLFFPIFMNYT